MRIHKKGLCQKSGWHSLFFVLFSEKTIIIFVHNV